MAKIKGIEKCGKSANHNLNQRKYYGHVDKKSQISHLKIITFAKTR